MVTMTGIEDQRERDEIIAIQKREESLKKLMKETGCEIIQENGQRRIGGPPPSKYLYLQFVSDLIVGFL